MSRGRTPPCSQLRELSVLVGRELWLREMAGSFPWKLLTVPVYSSPSAKRTFPWEWLPWPRPCALLRARSDHSPIHPAQTEAGTWERAAQGHSMLPGNQHSVEIPAHPWGSHCPETKHTPIQSFCPVRLPTPQSPKAPSLRHHLPTTKAVDLKLGSKGQRPLPSSRRTLPASSRAKVKLAMFCGRVDKWLRAKAHSKEVPIREMCRGQTVCPPYTTVYVTTCVQWALIPDGQGRGMAWKAARESNTTQTQEFLTPRPVFQNIALLAPSARACQGVGKPGRWPLEVSRADCWLEACPEGPLSPGVRAREELPWQVGCVPSSCSQAPG